MILRFWLTGPVPNHRFLPCDRRQWQASPGTRQLTRCHIVRPVSSTRWSPAATSAWNTHFLKVVGLTTPRYLQALQISLECSTTTKQEDGFKQTVPKWNARQGELIITKKFHSYRPYRIWTLDSKMFQNCYMKIRSHWQLLLSIDPTNLGAPNPGPSRHCRFLPRFLSVSYDLLPGSHRARQLTGFLPRKKVSWSIGNPAIIRGGRHEFRICQKMETDPTGAVWLVVS